MNLKEKKYLLLDLDGVCYGKHNNYSLERVFGQVSKRMTQFISEKLNVSIEEAKKRLFRGELVIFPTETVSGIGGNANNHTSVEQIYKTKNRPISNPLICHFANIRELKKNFIITNKDYELAKKSIQAFEKGQWPRALSFSKKTKDKSIYNFMQWRHLITTGNQASFYDYKVFIDGNPEYPRIYRVRYLAEHKLSTANVSTKKIITWFGSNNPLRGYGKMIIGKSHLLIGD